MAAGGASAPGEAEGDGGGSMPQQNPIQYVGDKTFILQDGVWTDTTFAPDSMETVDVTFLSDAYFDLLDAQPALAEYFALGDSLIVVWEGVAYQVMPEA
jgi:Ca-activated chloride channel family protein